jgi:hypothetical protein
VPLYRLNEIFARMGADIPDTTMVDWCGRAMRALTPLGDRIDQANHGQRPPARRRHADPGARQVPQGRASARA